jgi:hypothetical protein
MYKTMAASQDWDSFEPNGVNWPLVTNARETRSQKCSEVVVNKNIFYGMHPVVY